MWTVIVRNWVCAALKSTKLLSPHLEIVARFVGLDEIGQNNLYGEIMWERTQPSGLPHWLPNLSGEITSTNFGHSISLKSTSTCILQSKIKLFIQSQSSVYKLPWKCQGYLFRQLRNSDCFFQFILILVHRCYCRHLRKYPFRMNICSAPIAHVAGYWVFRLDHSFIGVIIWRSICPFDLIY